jgi:hypothetical protein
MADELFDPFAHREKCLGEVGVVEQLAHIVLGEFQDVALLEDIELLEAVHPRERARRLLQVLARAVIPTDGPGGGDNQLVQELPALQRRDGQRFADRLVEL